MGSLVHLASSKGILDISKKNTGLGLLESPSYAEQLLYSTRDHLMFGNLLFRDFPFD